VVFHSFFRDDQHPADFQVRRAFGQQAEYLDLALAEGASAAYALPDAGIKLQE
jgi:hypothetical protein